MEAGKPSPTIPSVKTKDQERVDFLKENLELVLSLQAASDLSDENLPMSTSTKDVVPSSSSPKPTKTKRKTPRGRKSPVAKATPQTAAATVVEPVPQPPAEEEVSAMLTNEEETSEKGDSKDTSAPVPSPMTPEVEKKVKEIQLSPKEDEEGIASDATMFNPGSSEDYNNPSSDVDDPRKESEDSDEGDAPSDRVFAKFDELIEQSAHQIRYPPPDRLLKHQLDFPAQRPTYPGEAEGVLRGNERLVVLANRVIPLTEDEYIDTLRARLSTEELQRRDERFAEECRSNQARERRLQRTSNLEAVLKDRDRDADQQQDRERARRQEEERITENYRARIEQRNLLMTSGFINKR